MNVYDLSRSFWDFTFENSEKVKPNHIAMYFFAIEHCNRLGWKKTFGFPTSMVMDAIGLKSYNTYSKTLQDLVDFGFIKMIEKSKNQYSSNIIALSKNNKAQYKALDKAIIAHSVCSIKKEQSIVQSTSESIVQSIDSINKPIYQSTNLPIYDVENFFFDDETKTRNFLLSQKITIENLARFYKLEVEQVNSKIHEFIEKKFRWEENTWTSEKDLKKNFEFWLKENGKAIVNPYKTWNEKDFKAECEKHKKEFGAKTLTEFFRYWNQPTETGVMRFQEKTAWDTLQQLKIWRSNGK